MSRWAECNACGVPESAAITETRNIIGTAMMPMITAAIRKTLSIHNKSSESMLRNLSNRHFSHDYPRSLLQRSA